MKKVLAILAMALLCASASAQYVYPDYRQNGGTCGNASPPEYCGVANNTDGTLTAVSADFGWVVTPKVVGQSEPVSSLRFAMYTVPNFSVDQGRAYDTQTSSALWQAVYETNQSSSCSEASITLLATKQYRLTATCAMAMSDGSVKNIVVDKTISSVRPPRAIRDLWQLDGGTVNINVDPIGE